jgi:hypothetical protein
MSRGIAKTGMLRAATGDLDGNARFKHILLAEKRLHMAQSTADVHVFGWLKRLDHGAGASKQCWEP